MIRLRFPEILRHRLAPLGAGTFLLLAGWSGAFLILSSSCSSSRELDTGIWLNARLQTWPVTGGIPSRIRIDGREIHAELGTSTTRMLARSGITQSRFSTWWNTEALFAERTLADGRILRFSMPLDAGRRTPTRSWLGALLCLATGSAAPLWLLWRQLHDERQRIGLLMDTARAAEAGHRLQQDGLDARWGLKKEVRLAHDLGSEVRRLKVLLHSEERRLQRLLDATGEGIALLDMQGRILLCNRHAARILRLDEGLARIGRTQAAGQSVTRAVRNHSLFTLAPELEFLDHLRSGLADTGAREFEFSSGREEIRQFSVRLSAAHVDMRRPGWILTIFDITARRAAERLQQRFISNVSHEFKTPLTSIRGYAETLEDEMEDDGVLDPMKAKFLDRILAGTSQLEEIVADLLDLGQLGEAGKLRRANDPVDLTAVCRQAMATVEPQAQSRQVHIEFSPAPLTVRGDAGKLMRAVLNLLSNAVKYGSSPGIVQLQLEHQGEEAVISVIDHGAGIPPEKLGNLFERFYRVDEGRSRAMGGTGLGLAIVREVAEAHGGQAEASSVPGQGSCFRLHLPLPTTAQAS